MAAPGKTLDLFPQEPAGQIAIDRKQEKPEGNSASKRPTFARPSLRNPVSVPQESRRSHPLWIAVHLPRLPLEAAGRVSSAPAMPLVLIETFERRQRVVACDQAAMHAGVVPGMGLDAAYARCSQLD